MSPKSTSSAAKSARTAARPDRAGGGPAQSPLVIDASPLGPSAIADVARRGRGVRFGAEARRRVSGSRAALERALHDGEAHYGVNTGFGSFSRQRIAAPELAELQVNLVRSHAAGVGKPLGADLVRAMMVLLAGSLSRGHSGVKPATAQAIVNLINAGITPVVPEIGSVGASGDLAPLAHVALVLIGEGRAELNGRILPGGSALAKAGLTPIALSAKEGLALINGTHLMAAQGVLLIEDLVSLVDAAMIASAMSIDACRATDAFLDARVHEARCQPGQIAVARRLRELLAGSHILPSHTLNDPRVQDPYSLRCVPQVLGAAMDLIAYAHKAIERELGAVTDNPLVFESPMRPGRPASVDIVSAGNFHGMPLAVAFDVVAIALSHIAGIAERRVYHMLSGFDPESGLPPYLSPSPGLHSGLMIAQYTAAACCNELIGLATPASVANLSTSAGMEDYNSFGPRSAAKARRGIELCRSVVAIELVCASAAIEHHRPLRSSPPVEAGLAQIRSGVPPLKADRPPAPDIARVEAMIEAGAFSGR
jgi:histidine ammonia-lyase